MICKASRFNLEKPRFEQENVFKTEPVVAQLKIKKDVITFEIN